MKKIVLLFIITSFILSPSLAQPVISSFAPLSGPVGTTVTLTGSNFNATPSNNVVFFGSVMAPVTAASTGSLTVNAPASSTFQYISVTDITTGLTAYSLKQFSVTFTCATSLSTSSFASRLDFSSGVGSGSGSKTTAIADFDGDGRPEIASSNTFSQVSVLQNNCTNQVLSFDRKLDLSAINGTYRVATGDLDGDGKLDLLVGSTSPNTVSIYRNTSTLGNTSFAARIDMATTAQPYSIAVVDLDGDGKPDMGVSAFSSSPLIIYRNTSSIGSISFAAPLVFPSGPDPLNAAIGDLDGDNKPDIAVTAGTSIEVSRNTSTLGSISFDPKIQFPTGLQPYGVAIGDIDADGKKDLVSANYNSNTVSILRNLSTSGSLNFATKVDFPTGSKPYCVAIANIDGDGKLDVAVVNSTANTFSIIKNTSTIGVVSFAAKIDYACGINPVYISISDLDNDEKPDVVISLAGVDMPLSVYKNLLCETVPQPPAISSFSPVSGPAGTTVSIVGTNFNPLPSGNLVYFGAEKAYVSAATTTTLTVTVPIGATYEKFSVSNNTSSLSAYSSQPFLVTFACGGGINTAMYAARIDSLTGTNPLAVVMADMDNDGKSDLITSNRTANTISIRKNTSVNGLISYASKIDFATVGSESKGVAVGDLDADGRIDVVSTGSNYIGIFRNTTSGTISLGPRVDYYIDAPNNVVIDDLDGDGKPELIVARKYYGQLLIFKNISVNGFIAFAAPRLINTGSSWTYTPAVTDLDGDGKRDILVTETSGGSNELIILKNTTNPLDYITFAAPVTYPIGNVYDVKVADMDGDGKPDAVLPNYASGMLCIFRNTGTPGTIAFAPRADFPAAVSNSITIEDLNGDGKPDVALGPRVGTQICLKENTSTPGNLSFIFPSTFIVTDGTGAIEGCSNIAAGDIDGDGKPDLAVANYDSSTVSFFMNQQCPATGAFPVWPGDTDNDAVVNNNDLLPIGLYYSQLGIPRASISNLWQADSSASWGTTQANGFDIKHVDCNGDSIINSNDTLAVNLNFSSFHAYSENHSGVKTINPDLYFVTASSTYNAGDIVDVEVWTGTAALPVSNLYGLAFNIGYDASLVQPATESLTYPTSWLGTIGTDAISIARNAAVANTEYGGITRIVHTDISGYGKIADFKFQANSSISSPSVMHLSVSGYKANDAMGAPVAFNLLNDSITIYPLGTSIANSNSASEITISPNPFTSQTTILFAQEQKQTTIKIMDVLGKEMRTMMFSGKQLLLEKEEMQNGIYFIQIIDVNKKVTIKRIILQ